AAKGLSFKNATKHNLRNLSFRLPLQRLVCLSGVSGSGKSTLLDNVIGQGLLTQRNLMTEDPAEIEAIKSDLAFSEVVIVDQSPLSRTPRSNPALYCEAWELIRELYATVPAAQEAGFSASSFSFNSGDGRCDNCQGLGSERVEMQFLSDVFVPCPICEGKRFKPEVLAITWSGQSIADLLAMNVTDALKLFAGHDEIHRRLAALAEVGLGYLPLGQPLNTLSGGESQRLKLVRYLSEFTDESDAGRALRPTSAPAVGDKPRPTEEPARALLLLDEPTTGLHRHDVKRLLEVLQRIVDRGHSIVVIEHNLDVLKSADWLLEVGPEAGAAGGKIVAEGPPEALARAATATSPFLREALNCRAGSLHPATAHDQAGSDDPALHLAAAEDPAPYQASLTAGPGELTVLGARENNLKNISVSIPHRQLSVITGVSGSGKSTLAFDIIFAEGQRRFMESMSPYARQFVEQLPRPDIDRLSGIPPTVAIEQRVTRGSRKSTVATITEVAQYLRLLYAKLGIQHHPETGRPVTPLSSAQLRRLLDQILATPKAKQAKHLYLCAPVIRSRKGHHEPIAKWIGKQGYELMRADGRLLKVETFQKLDRYKEHDIEVVVADLKAGSKEQEAKSQKHGTQRSALGAQLATALKLGKGACFLLTPGGEILSWFSTTRTDIESGESFPELDPKYFSFNSPKGWCPTCRGHGRIYDWMLKPDEDEERSDEVVDALRAFDPDDPASHGQLCPTCRGERLNRIARAVRLPLNVGARLVRARFGRGQATPLHSISLPELGRLMPAALLKTLRDLQLDARGKLITQDIIPQIEERLRFLGQVGLDYLQLDRPTETLSGGEAQRIRLAAQLGSNLSGVLYVLDEPSIGLHARDNDRLIDTLLGLRDKGNTVLVVEHDDVVMARADRIIDLGPGAGIHGGKVLANESPAGIKQNASSLTGLFLAKGINHPIRGTYRTVGTPLAGARGRRQATPRQSPDWLELTGVTYRNLRDQNLRLPLGRLTMVCGPSGAGKSTLFRDILHPAVSCAIKRKASRLTGKDFARRVKFESDSGGAATPPRTDARGRGRPRSSFEPFASLTGANHV
ncbi:MAG: ATP-binding cassette domain-containing protein, partial [Lacunisphaera sp.]|nr:ATP-binding cassette domain-containing protein [Lacunisphaera sp.]